MPDAPDYYEVIQVHRSAEPEVVQAAYRRLSMKYHPDVYKGADAQQRMALLNEAYSVLSDPEKRAAYDRQRYGTGGHQAPVLDRPLLQVSPTEVNLGAVPAGRTRIASIHVRNAGQGVLSGLAVSHVPWLQVSPAEFNSNELDVVLRFQPGLAGDYGSPNAVEVYSNGGRAAIAVRGSLEPALTPRRSPAGPGAAAAGIPRAAGGARPTPAQRHSAALDRPRWAPSRVPFMVWVVAGTLVSSAIWFLIAPALVVIPVGLGAWLGWDHLARRPRTSGSERPRRGAAVLGRCLACGASSDPARARKCPRCGGSICPSCGACACRRRAR